MNHCVLSGQIANKPLVLGNGQGIRFTLRTRYPSRQEGVSAGTAYVPCVVFELSKEHLDVLQDGNYKKLRIELSGRIRRSSYEGESGERVYNTEVVCNGSSLLLQRVK